MKEAAFFETPKEEGDSEKTQLETEDQITVSSENAIKKQELFRMTQEQVRNYLLENKDRGAYAITMDILPFSVSPEDRDENGDTNWERVYREIPAMYEIDPYFASELENYVGQNGQMIKPEVFMDVIFGEYCKDDQSYFFQRAMHSLNYVYSFHTSKRTNEYIASNLDFKNPANFDRTAKMLDFVAILFNVGQGNSSWSNTGHYVRELLHAVIEGSEGSYLLRVKAVELTQLIDEALSEDGDIYDQEYGERDQDSYVMNSSMRRIVSEEMHFNMDDLTETEQRYFLEYIKVKPAKEISEISNFVSKYGKSGLRTFLSLQHKSELGDRLVAFGGGENRQAAQALFDKFGEIADVSERILSYLKEEFGDSFELNTEIVNEISDKLMQDGSQLLETFISKSQEALTQEEIKELTSSLESVKADTLAFLSAFRAIKRSNAEFAIEDVKNLNLSTVGVSEISPDDLLKMRNMYVANYAQYPKLSEYLTRKFDEAVKNPETSMSILRRNGEIVAFYRLGVAAQDGVLYFGSFNVDPTYQGALLGETLMQESLDVKAKENIILAECNPRVGVSANYIERGFIAVKGYKVEEIDVLDIVRNDRMNPELVSRNVSSDEVINNGISDEGVRIYSVPTRDISLFKFDFIGEKVGDKIEVLTRYIKDKKRGMTYFVTELVSPDFIERYSTPYKQN